MSRIVWAPPSAHVAVWKNPPDVLLTSMQPKTAAEWRAKNTWADNLEMIVFTDDPPRGFGAPSFVLFAEASGQAPHAVVNAPPLSRRLLDIVRNTSGLGPAWSYGMAVASVGLSLLDKRVAWLQPESDHSIGAVHLATTRGKNGIVLAISSRAMMDAVGSRAAGHHGIDVQTLGTIKGEGLYE